MIRPSPGDLPDPRIKPASPVLPVDSLQLSHWEAHYKLPFILKSYFYESSWQFHFVKAVSDYDSL